MPNGFDEAATAGASAAARQASQTVAQELLRHSKEIATKKYDQILNHLQAGFQNYLDRNISRCSHVKTLIRRNDPISLNSIYVQQVFENDDKYKTDEDVIKHMHSNARFIVSGFAGSGKSMFMKHAFLEIAAVATDRIPIFLELKSVNDYANDANTLLQAITQSINSITRDFNINRLDDGLQRGKFLLLFDGFDEIKHDMRQDIEKQIILISHRYPSTPILVSSRPDDRFTSWQEFTELPVKAMSKEQIEKLVRKTKCDQPLQDKFIKSLHSGLYESHQSFLENPLLATMMLLTFDQWGGVPDKMSSFYDRCFDVLVREHDTTKQLFVRRMYSRLSPEELKEAFTYFCAASYLDNMYYFSESELQKYLQKAIDARGLNVSSDSLKYDFIESISILKKEGTEYAFIHRTFQEYFMASFLVWCNAIDPSEAIFRVQGRLIADNVLGMALDVDHEYLEKQFLLPSLNRLCNIINTKNVERDPVGVLSLFFDSLEIIEFEECIGYSVRSDGDSFHILLDILETFYKNFVGIGFFELIGRAEELQHFEDDKYILKEYIDTVSIMSSVPEISLCNLPNDQLKKTSSMIVARNIAACLLTFRNKLEDKLNQRAKNLSDILLNS